MSYLKVHNPIDREVKTCFEGEYYTIKAEGTESYPEALAKKFVEIYPFMTLDAKAPKVEKKAVKEVVEEAVEEVKEAVKEVKKKVKK